MEVQVVGSLPHSTALNITMADLTSKNLLYNIMKYDAVKFLLSLGVDKSLIFSHRKQHLQYDHQTQRNLEDMLCNELLHLL